MKKNLKKVISAVLALTLAMSSFVAMTSVSAATTKFADVADTASYAEAVNALAALGAISGYEDGTFLPDNNITRAEATTMVVAALNMTADAQNAGTTTQFADVNANAKWAAGYVNVGVANSFISGMSATEFAPNANVTYAQMLTILTRILGYGDFAVSRGGFPKGYLTSASLAGILSGVSASANEAVTRAQVAQLIWNTVQAPMLDITTFTGSIADTQLQKMDGKNGRNWKTVLSEKYDAYVLDVKVEDTSKTGAGLEIGTITMTRTNTNQWDPANKFAIVATVDDTTSPIPYTPVDAGATDAEDYLFSSAKTVAQYSDNGDWTLVYFAPTSKVATKTVDGTLVDAATTTTELKIKKSATSRYTTSYTLSAGAELYVNGVKYVDKDDTTKDTIAEIGDTDFEALLKASVGDAVLYQDTAVVNGKSYNRVMINVYTVAKVNQVVSTNDKTTVRLTAVNAVDEAVATGTSLTVTAEDIEDGSKVVSVTKSGKAAELAGLAKGDVVAIKHDITKSFAEGVHFEILATNDTVTGMYSSLDTDAKKFTIAGVEYEAVDFDAVDAVISRGNSYTFLLDPFGRIFAAGDEVTSMTYAIVEKYTDTSADAYDGGSEYDVLTVVTLDGQQKTLYVEDNATIRTTVKNVMDDINGGIDDDLAANGVNKFTGIELSNRVISYGVKASTGRVNKLLGVTAVPFSDAEYNSLTNKLFKNLSSSAVVLDATAYVTAAQPDAADMKSSSLSALVTNVGYDGFLVHQNASDNRYAYVVITEAGATYGPTSNFAVAAADAKVNSGTIKNEEDVYTLRVMKDGAEEADTLYISEEVEVSVNGASAIAYADNCVAKGDVFFYTVNSDGIVDRIDVVLTGVADFASLVDEDYTISEPASAKVETEDWFAPEIDEDATVASDEPIQLFLAPVVLATDGSVSFGTLSGDYVETEDTYDFSISANANIYYYDLSASAPIDYTAFSGGYFASIGTDVTGDGYAYFNNVPDGETDFDGIIQYAFVMAVDGVVTNAVVFGGEYVVD